MLTAPTPDVFQMVTSSSREWYENISFYAAKGFVNDVVSVMGTTEIVRGNDAQRGRVTRNEEM
jgi:hypothetical protein